MRIDDWTLTVRWSRRRSTIGLSVAPGGEIRVAAPVGTSTRAITTMVRSHEAWLRRAVVAAVAMLPRQIALPLRSGAIIPYRGRELSIERAAAHAPSLRLRGTRLFVAGEFDDERQALLRWYLRRARAVARERVRYFAPLVGVQPPRLVVRDLGRRRWGTCHSQRREIALHWPLIAAEPEILDYVVVHELCHLLAANHSPTYWREVERVLPDYRERRRQLRSGGRDLVLVADDEMPPAMLVE